MFLHKIILFAACLLMPIIPIQAVCTVMQFNIEEGGTLVSLSQIINVIRSADPDIVFIEEAEGNIPLIAAELGWPHYDARHQILSRFPIIDPSDGDGVYLFVEMSKGKYAAISNVHLPSHRYGPDLFKKGKHHSLISYVEQKLRLKPIKKYLEVLPSLAAQGIPVILAGDFNTPSYLDWTYKSTQKEGMYEFLSFFAWPASLAVANAGFRDSYREVHPNPHTKPGFTWWADRPSVSGWNPDKEDLHDRIDFIYVMGPAETKTSHTTGPCCAETSLSPWPSDHCALVSTFDIAPSHKPIFVSVNKRLISTEETLTVTYNAPHALGQKIVIVQSGKNSKILATNQINDKFNGTLQFSTDNWMGHAYEVQLLNNLGKITSKIPFFVKAPEEQTTVSVNKNVFSYKEPIVVHWHNAPGNRWDWIGIFSLDHDSDEEVMWRTTNTEIEGRCKFNAKGKRGWPLPPGHYKAGYYLDESYKEIAQVQFTIE